MKKKYDISKDESVVRCSCGLILRKKKWQDHWYTCRTPSARPATREEISLLEHQEQRLKEEAEEHRRWRDDLYKGKP